MVEVANLYNDQLQQETEVSSLAAKSSANCYDQMGEDN